MRQGLGDAWSGEDTLIMEVGVRVPGKIPLFYLTDVSVVSLSGLSVYDCVGGVRSLIGEAGEPQLPIFKTGELEERPEADVVQAKSLLYVPNDKLPALFK